MLKKKKKRNIQFNIEIKSILSVDKIVKGFNYLGLSIVC